MLIIGKDYLSVGSAVAMVWSSADSSSLMVIVLIGLVFIAVGARGRRNA